MLTETVQAYCNPDEVSIPDVDKWCLRNQANGKKKTTTKTPQKTSHQKTYYHKRNPQTIIKYSNSILIYDKKGNQFQD